MPPNSCQASRCNAVPHGRPLAVVGLAAMLAAVACTSPSAPDASPSGLPSPSVATTTGQETEGPSQAPSDDALSLADAACRDSTYRDPGLMTVVVTLGDLVTIVYTGPEGDFLCQWLPRYGETAVVQGGFEHFADQLTVETPMVRDPNQSWTSATGTYVWGAVGPDVASVVIELGSADDLLEATIAEGYFLAVVGPDVPCCLYTAVALDAGGNEIARAQ